ncbi:hypothetical protein ACHAW5_002761 [Stephanodiscus triporus]|uniref:ATP-dependent transporter ycf16 n=1 Tax=Stephanodiscus triporus TaxID=2934178 RepID=A0ABD3QAU7_9STRA
MDVGHRRSRRRIENADNRHPDFDDEDDDAILRESDLPDVLPHDASGENLRRFNDMWEGEKRRVAALAMAAAAAAKKKGRPPPTPPSRPSLHRAVAMDFLRTMWFVQPLMFASSTAKLVQALALGFLLQTFAGDDGDDDAGGGGGDRGNGYLWAGVLVLSGFVVLMEHHHVFFWTWRKGMQYRVAFIAAIYDKSLRLNSTSVAEQRSSPSSADATSELTATRGASSSSSSSGKIVNIATNDVERLLMASLFVSYLFWAPVQSVAIFGIGWYVIGWSFAAGFGILIFFFVPLQVWLSQRFAHMRSKIAAITDERVTMVSQAVSGVRVMKMNGWEDNFGKRIASIRARECEQIERVNSYRVLNEAIFFVCNVTTSFCIFAIHVASGGVLTSQNVFTTMVLINVAQMEITKHLSLAVGSATSSGLIVALEDVNVDFRMGDLTCVIGAVGSGKSAMIQMLAGELPPSLGSIRRRRGTSVAYAPQDPWIMDGTVRENILLGFNYDSETYSTVIRACGLHVDLEQLRDGDDTIVGDRGVQLSGGQRARIALARAFYRDADIILLDDPLSAVDSRVGRVLFYSAIQDLGVKRGKCVVLVTHQHQYIGDSRCIMMSGGRIACVGSYQTCVEASDGKLTFAAQHHSSNDLVKLDSSEAKPIDLREEATSSVTTLDKEGDPESSDGNIDDHKEVRVVGEVKRTTFLNYLRAMPGGIISGILMMILFTATQAAVLACIATLGRWSELPAEDQSSGSNIGLVGGLVGAVILLAVVLIQASKKLHDDMTRSVLRAKISFFDTNPIGRVLNRFSSDVGSNDDQLPVTMFDFLVISFLVVGALVSTIVVLPITLVVLPPIMWYFLRVRNIFATTSRELKRLEGLARSPIFAMLSESLSGISTIRANNALDFFQDKFRRVHDAHGRAFFAFISCSRWLGFRMDALMFIFLTVASFAAVVVHQQAWMDIDPAILGLAISMLIQLSGLFQWCIRQSAEVVNMMVAVERVLGYRDLPSEAELTNSFDEGVKDWPENGEINVTDLAVRYRKGLPLSLRGVSFKIEGGSRVGIVGRTGGGKSTLVQALLRLLEAEGGQITIDGVDIAKLGLHKLRTCVSVIPQSPVLYGGCSLRENLDPFHHHDDNQIGEALSDVHMLDVIISLPHGLDTTVAEGGLNFSVGQRQLLCLARAILRRNKILVLDEPTANIDSHTDKLLQEAVSKSFAGATILAVAHRLDTVINYDKILVLGSGGVLEFGSPRELIANGGAFCSMIDDTGEEMAATLKERARGG